jgi:hypothetical protein
MYRFLQTPPDVTLGVNSYTDKRSGWFPDVNLNCTYSFLSNDESRIFAKNEQKYLFKQVNEKIFYNVTGSNKVDLDSLGLISNWMFYFQRSDVNLRNEWTNYTNWPYNFLPSDIIPASTNGEFSILDGYNNTTDITGTTIGPGVNPNGLLSGSGSVIADLQSQLFTAVNNNDLVKARELNNRIFPMSQVFYADPWVDMHNRMKEALVLLGKLPRAVVRPPLMKISETEIAKIKNALIQAKLLDASGKPI